MSLQALVSEKDVKKDVRKLPSAAVCLLWNAVGTKSVTSVVWMECLSSVLSLPTSIQGQASIASTKEISKKTISPWFAPDFPGHRTNVFECWILTKSLYLGTQKSILFPCNFSPTQFSHEGGACYRPRMVAGVNESYMCLLGAWELRQQRVEEVDLRDSCLHDSVGGDEMGHFAPLTLAAITNWVNFQGFMIKARVMLEAVTVIPSRLPCMLCRYSHLYGQLCDLYENDSIFDKFECCLSGDGLRVATGSYSCLSFFLAIQCVALLTCIESSSVSLLLQPLDVIIVMAISTAFEYSSICFEFLVVSLVVMRRPLWKLAKVPTGNESPGAEMNGGAYDFSTKLLHLAWHPTANAIACAASNSLYMYDYLKGYSCSLVEMMPKISWCIVILSVVIKITVGVSKGLTGLDGTSGAAFQCEIHAKENVNVRIAWSSKQYDKCILTAMSMIILFYCLQHEDVIIGATFSVFKYAVLPQCLCYKTE
eukprot:Gb_31983 [translate_table: standard]